MAKKFIWVFSLVLTQKNLNELFGQPNIYLLDTDAIKMDNEEEMDKFLEQYNFPKLNQEEIENLNRSVTSMEIETVIRNLQTNKITGPDGFTAKFTKNLEKS